MKSITAILLIAWILLPVSTQAQVPTRLDWNDAMISDNLLESMIRRLQDDNYVVAYDMAHNRSLAAYLMSVAPVNLPSFTEPKNRFKRMEPVAVLVTATVYPDRPHYYITERFIVKAEWSADSLTFEGFLQVNSNTQRRTFSGSLSEGFINVFESDDLYLRWSDHTESKSEREQTLRFYRQEVERQECGQWSIECHIIAYLYARTLARLE